MNGHDLFQLICIVGAWVISIEMIWRQWRHEQKMQRMRDEWERTYRRSSL